MSLTDKVIKNTVYHILSQAAGFIFPLLLTPFIISRIGNVQFGLYALLLGFLGTFHLFDFSIFTSFIKFISEYYNQKDFKRLNFVINTGFFFYFAFSIIILVVGWVFTKQILSIINIPTDLIEISVYSFRLSLFAFFVSSITTIFPSVLISLQRMYIASITGLLIGILNFVLVIIFLLLGFGLKGLIWCQFITAFLTGLIYILYSKKYLPEMRIGFKNFNIEIFGKMGRFGIQMQISKLATFASSKYDEFLLGYFSVLNNVTYYNIASRVARVGHFFPYQLIPQVAPVAAELSAKREHPKLVRLFEDTSKYLILVSAPVFLYILFFSDLIIETWMGKGYEISAYILKIIVIGQLFNLMVSAPGNSIIPNTGKPRYQMFEGLIYLILNIVLSYFFIKYYLIVGAAYGNTIGTIIASTYVFFTSCRFFGISKTKLLLKQYVKPLLSGVISAAISYLAYFLLINYILKPDGRLVGIVYIFVTFIVFISLFFTGIANFNYINSRDREIILKAFFRIVPVKLIFRKTIEKIKNSPRKQYENEFVSIYVLTYNRLELFKKCLFSLLRTLEGINFELILWDNNSTDGTKNFLKEFEKQNGKLIKENRLRVVYNDKNIGTAGKGKSVELAKGEFIIGVDDDVIEFPEHWIQKMIYAYKNIPFMGYLATDVVQDDKTNGAKPSEKLYVEETYDGGNIVLQVGPTGGWCFMVSRSVYNEIGKFYFPKKRIFFLEDGDYGVRTLGKGYKVGILKNCKVYHAVGDYYNKAYSEIMKGKAADLKIKDPIIYKLRRRLKRIFSIKRYYRKLIDYALRM